VTHDDAVALASAADETVASCILDLYRSATPNICADWKDDFGPTPVPGLVLWPTEDPFGDETQSRQVAEMLGARHRALDGLSHWWPLQSPAPVAKVLTEFVSSLDRQHL